MTVDALARTSSIVFRPSEATPFETAAKALGIPLSIVSVAGDEARNIYQADLALIRPDQIVAWRGNSPANAVSVLRQASGHS